MHWSSALILYIQPAMSAIGYLPRRAFWKFCEFVHSNTILQRELNICSLLMCSCISHLLALKYLNGQSLHEFSLNTDINMCCSGLTCEAIITGDNGINDCSYYSIWHSHWTRAWMVCQLFFLRCCNLLGSQNAHPSIEAYIGQTLFFLRDIYNKPYCRCLSDLSWNAVLAQYFSTNRSTPLGYPTAAITI